MRRLLFLTLAGWACSRPLYAQLPGLVSTPLANGDKAGPCPCRRWGSSPR